MSRQILSPSVKKEIELAKYIENQKNVCRFCLLDQYWNFGTLEYLEFKELSTEMRNQSNRPEPGLAIMGPPGPDKNPKPLNSKLAVPLVDLGPSVMIHSCIYSECTFQSFLRN